MKYLVLIDDSEANRGYSPKTKKYIEAKNLSEAKRKVAKLIDISVSWFEQNEPGEYLIDGF